MVQYLMMMMMIMMQPVHQVYISELFRTNTCLKQAFVGLARIQNSCNGTFQYKTITNIKGHQRHHSAPSVHFFVMYCSVKAYDLVHSVNRETAK
jgi:hypothetical protein